RGRHRPESPGGTRVPARRRPTAHGAGDGIGRRVPENAAAQGIRPCGLQPERLPLRELTMHPHRSFARSRREFLTDAFGGFGALALTSLFADDVRADDPLAPKKPHFEAKAKSVIFLFMAGGPSHIDT